MKTWTLYAIGAALVVGFGFGVGRGLLPLLGLTLTHAVGWVALALMIVLGLGFLIEWRQSRRRHSPPD